MKKNSSNRVGRQSKKAAGLEITKGAPGEQWTIGLDLGDRMSHYCILNAEGEVVMRDKVATNKVELTRRLDLAGRVRVVMEAGTHSPWVSRCVVKLGHEVIVANPRKVALITDSRRKNDRIDAEKLARLGRIDPQLLSPIVHRSEQAQEDLAQIRARHELVRVRTALINSARGLVKSFGYRLEHCDADQMGPARAAELPGGVKSSIEPLLETAAQLTAQIKAADQRIHEIGRRYPEIELVTVIYGVGELTALTFVLTVEDVSRFGKSREVGPYLGLVPGQWQSGDRDTQQRITKEGDRMVRWMLVQCAHTILRHGAPNSDLRRWGLAKLEQEQQKPNQMGKKTPRKKKVLVAVARRLGVLMHHLLATGQVYDPLYGAKQQTAQAAAKARKAARQAA
ncbi:MAG: IS110 family transposase [Nitrospirota bacterium]